MLPAEESNTPTEILGFIDLDLYKPELQGTQDLELERGNQGMDPRDYGEGATIPEEELEQLSKIISEINDAFGTTFTPDDRVIISRLQEQLKNDDKLENLAKNSSKNATEKAFEEVAFSLLGNLIDSDFKFIKKCRTMRSYPSSCVLKPSLITKIRNPKIRNNHANGVAIIRGNLRGRLKANHYQGSSKDWSRLCHDDVPAQKRF